MKVSKDMLNEGLKDMYWPMKFLAFMLSKTWTMKLMNKLAARGKGATFDGLHCEELFIPSRNGDHDIRIRLFKPLHAAGELPGMLYIHGGGYVIGSPESAIDFIKALINAEPCVIIAPDYRKALDAPYPAAFNDCYDSLLWLKEHAPTLGIRSDKFIVGGHSAGGGLTAAVTLKAADTQDVAIAFQLPIYPMIDDRQVSASASNCDAPVWNSKTNKLGWHHYLKDLNKNNSQIPAYAAAARGTDYSKLPPTITFVGDLEPFKDETIDYVARLKKAGVPVEFKIYEGCFHAFETVAPKAEISQEAHRFLFNAFGGFVDRYFARNVKELV